MLPAHRVIGPESGPVAFIVHGILGSGANLVGLARALSARHPAWRLVLPDLRGHGDSAAGPPPHTLAACAADLAELAEQVGHPRVVIGHSFGGKVVLLYGRDHRSAALHDVWVLDAPPGTHDDTTRHEVVRVLAAARGLVPPFASREAVSAHFQAAGLSAAIATWMTTNVARRPEGLVFRPKLDVIEALLADYFRNDLWDFLEHPPPGLGLHVVRAGRSDRWDAATLARLARVPVDVQVLPKAGHWVHVDDPEGLMALLGGSLD